MENVLLEMKNISKQFPGVKALDDVNLRIYSGRIMALLGENGAGKSTLMKILTGVYQKTQGAVIYEGKEVNFANTKESQDRGIAFIHQELNLIPQLTIGENIFLGREPTKLGKINWGHLYKETAELLKRLGVAENPKAITGSLSVGKQQMVEIAKALSMDAKIIIMDEPTDALTDTETEHLFKVILELKSEGRSIVYISHRLKEVFEICDDATILRDGTFISEQKVSDLNEDTIIELMVGRKLTERYPHVDTPSGEYALEVKNLNNSFVKDISFNIKKSEIVGIAGLMGAGRTELAKTIFGAIPRDSGEIFVYGERVANKSPKHGILSGITYVSEDRKRDGLIMGLSVKENMSLSALKYISKSWGAIQHKKEDGYVEEYIRKMSIKTPGINQLVKYLSGGNQQKVSIAKSLMTKPKVLILDEPTRGVDVGAKKEIYDMINQLKKEGLSILMISSEIPEILGMCDRILFMHEGKIKGELLRGQATQENIMRYAVDVKGGV